MPEPTPDESTAALEAFLGVHPAGRTDARDDLIERVWADRAYELRAGQLRALLADRFAMLDLLAEFIAMDGQECDVDRAGDCRPHGYYPTAAAGIPCPYQQARDLLAANKDALESRQQRRAARARAQLESMLEKAGRMQHGQPDRIER